MKQKIIIWLSVILLLAIVAFMVKDLFYQSNSSNDNPYEYKMDKLRHIDSSLIGYKQYNLIKPDIEQLHGIAVDKSDNIFIAGKDKVIVYNSELKEKLSFKTGKEAKCIAIEDNGSVYFGIQDHLEVYDSVGKFLKSWNPVNEKSVITSIAVTEKFVYVADAGNRIVYQYDKTGNLIKKIGKKDVDKGIPGFIIPSPYFDLLIGREGELWVANPGRHSLESYNEKGDLISSWTKTSMDVDGFCGCCNPSNIAMLSDGSFVTSEKAIERVKIHLPSGEFKTVVASPENFNEGTKGIDLAVDSKDRIFVLDPVKKSVCVYIKK
ncbi:MAG: hypothetical protein HOO91_02490 [Bacteroidales bacterium]|nr:hypothetical protein [Bacteroidales bacterium]